MAVSVTAASLPPLPDSWLCFGDVCQKIRCSKGRGFRTPGVSPLDGTTCGRNKERGVSYRGPVCHLFTCRKSSRCGRIGPSGSGDQWLHTEEAPCHAPFQDCLHWLNSQWQHTVWFCPVTHPWKHEQNALSDW
ncbi:uncharacterized protein LOC123512331 [Portunus trituberculatus]|uniref:uncharacterized protein LOC123512331 n=1 Tax=Portunus trituberculatus TaxID=210409 RepID=UPI001E1D00B3|nr:uncharacterized protein LOC123512331 [Portunus trituberculatus]